MSNRKMIVVAIFLVIAAISGYWILGGQSAEARTAVATRGSIDVTIETVGTIQATGATVVRSTVAGVVDRIGVESGDYIEPGDIIAILDQEPFERAVELARLDLEDAEFVLQAAEQAAARNQDDPTLARDVVMAANAVERAQRAVGDARQALRDAVISAPRAGQVLDIAVRSGDATVANQPIATIAATDDLELIAEVDELDLPNVHPGAQATFRLDAYPATEIAGIVTSTAAQARLQGGVTIFATTITFDAPDGLDLRPGMNAEVRIVTDARTNVLMIPESALKTVGERVFVTVVTDDGREDREIVVGYRGDGQVEVVSGIAEGDEVVLY